MMLYYDIANNVTAFTTTREGGCSIGNYASMNVNPYCGDAPEHIAENRRRLCHELNILPHHLVMPHQTHQTKVATITPQFFEYTQEQQTAYLEGIDALMTDMKGIAIGVSTADCVPILIYDTRHHVAAAIHAGWRGTVQRIAEKAFEEMGKYYGTTGCDCKAIIGPSISKESFEVGDEVYETFRAQGFENEQLYSTLNGKWHIDLWECNRQQLMNKKIDAHNIHVAGICTYQSSDRFFSARKLGIQSGRLFSGIILR
ncbi:MAG: peptidoglycan editing factor PgeF [Bacteroidaceae bacterium]|nr:peptidoglycan editing factor PgeF [Bacteroidaceae bacterium]